MQLRRIHLESDADVLLSTGMTETVTLHAGDGTILVCRVVVNPIDDRAKYIGTLPYDWIDPKDHLKVRSAIAAASKGKIVTCVYMLRPSLYGGKGWCVQTEWSPSGCSDRPVLGISRTYAAILAKLTAKERDLVRLLGGTDAKCSAALQRKKSTTLRSAKSRLARKLEILPSQLLAFCAAYADLV